jgi:large-conductance mechanosensitive channel
MKGFAEWFFKKKDIDSTLIALLISIAISNFIDELSKGFIDPFITGLIKTGDKTQTITVLGRTFEFKLQLILVGLIKALFVLMFVYYLATGLKAGGY